MQPPTEAIIAVPNNIIIPPTAPPTTAAVFVSDESAVNLILSTTAYSYPFYSH